MPRPATPLTGIAKKLESLKAKSGKLAQEIADLSALVAKEAVKAQMAVPAPAPAVKKPATKKATTKAQGEPKKRGRPAKAKTQTTSDYLSMLNADPSDVPTTPKKRGKK